MPRRVTLPPELLRSSFRVADGAALGVGDKRLRSRPLTIPFRGVRLPGDTPSTTVELAQAYAPLLTPGLTFSHGTAAALWGMWLPTRLQRAGHVDVLALGSRRPPRMKGVRGHHADGTRVDVVVRSGLRVTSAVDTWRQLSTVLSVDELVQVGDWLVRRQHPEHSRSQLRAALARHGGLRGVKKLRAAFDLVRPGCDSPYETIVRLILIRSGLPEPLVNPVVSRPGDPKIYGDMVYPEWRVIVEYDGAHHDEKDQHDRDVRRLERLASEGWTVIRIRKSALRDPSEVVRRVSTALRAAGWRP